MDTSRLVDRAKLGDSAAIGRLYELFHARTLAHVRRLVSDPDAAEDTVQDAFLLAFQNLADLHEPNAFGAWVRAIAHHLCMHEAGNPARRKVSELRDCEAAFDPEPDLLSHVLSECICEAIGRLRADRSQIVRMYYIENRSLAEIGAAMNLTVDAARKRLHRGRIDLYRCFEEPGAAAVTEVHARSRITSYVLDLDAQSKRTASLCATYQFDLGGHPAASYASPPPYALAHETQAPCTTMIA